jgi:hypothetical protein
MGRGALWTIVAAAVGLAGCAQDSPQTSAPVVEDKTFALTPAAATTKVEFLTVDLKDLKVTQRVEQGTGTVVDPPQLHGTLEVKNTSEDQAVRLIAGEVRYLNRQGQAIRLAEDRDAPRFEFYSYSEERLDPGEATSKDLGVAFPAAALDGDKLQNLRVQLEYIPVPYREETVDVEVSLAK